ncbi:hypothetical protein PpBr36_02283 [Pyricularia pennisetigena]|nr:hypothetical protein PpBr36_02283 [Pyricularia pennisetigena]TLS30172.1 hypothetical protein PpBr36_02283 [Pyricularia pennisetigena]
MRCNPTTFRGLTRVKQVLNTASLLLIANLCSPFRN